MSYQRQTSFDGTRPGYYQAAQQHSPTIDRRPQYSAQQAPPVSRSAPVSSRPSINARQYSTRAEPIHRGATLKRNKQLDQPRDGILPTSVADPAFQRRQTLRARQAYGNESNMNGGATGLGNSSGTTRLARGKTLTRPDRHVAPAPLINPPTKGGAAGNLTTTTAELSTTQSDSWFKPWSFYVTISTFWAPNFMLRACGMTSALVQAAWREKMALCSIALILGAFVGFATIGLNSTLCPDNQAKAQYESIRIGTQAGMHAFSLLPGNC